MGRGSIAEHTVGKNRTRTDPAHVVPRRRRTTPRRGHEGAVCSTLRAAAGAYARRFCAPAGSRQRALKYSLPYGVRQRRSRNQRQQHAQMPVFWREQARLPARSFAETLRGAQGCRAYAPSRRSPARKYRAGERRAAPPNREPEKRRVGRNREDNTIERQQGNTTMVA